MSNFKLEQEDTELERLVRVANEGEQAKAALSQKYLGKFQFKALSAWIIDLASTYTPVEYRVIPEPMFKPFTVGSIKDNKPWIVDLIGDRIHIGCMKFKARLMKLALNSLCVHGANRQNLDGGLVLQATKEGVGLSSLEDLTYKGYSVCWEDADKILAALEEAGV